MTKKEFVSMSLPYGLKVVIPESNTKGCRKTVVGTVGVVFDDGSINCYDTVNASPKRYKPILRPMHEVVLLDRNPSSAIISEEDIKYLKKGKVSLDFISAFTFKILIEMHFDVAGLIDKKEAIDINIFEFNPYKKK